jgi:hypothetical protein
VGDPAASGVRRHATVGTIVLGVIALALALPAWANHTSQNDRNDTEGLLDLRAVRFDHERPVTWTFVTFAAWRPREIHDRGYFVVELDTRRDEAVDYFILLRSIGQDLQASLHRVRSDGTQVEMAKLQARKEGGRSARVELALRKIVIARRRTAYYWSATSLFTGGPCPRTCIDRAPDTGMVEQPLEDPEPSPSPTPSPSPSV